MRAAFKIPSRPFLLLVALFLSASFPLTIPAQGVMQGAKPKITSAFSPSSQSDGLSQYLQRARLWASQEQPTTGSLWNPSGSFSDLARDSKAHVLGDIVTIELIESTNSSQQGTVQTQRTLAASSNISAFFGIPGSRSAMQNIFSPNSSQALNGKGQATLQTSLTTTVTGNIVEVLPNGYLVIEATRDITVTDQRQTLVLRGIVRQDDISPANIVPSTSISQMEISMKGKGVISDGTRQPNPVVRFLLRVLGF